MDDVTKALARQAAWQESRKSLSWSQKVRMAEAIRGSVLKLRGAKTLDATMRDKPPKPA